MPLINHTRFSLQQAETGVACQTAFVGQRLWRVARRRVAIIGLQIGERRTRALQRVVAAADDFGSALEAAFDARIGTLQAAANSFGSRSANLHSAAGPAPRCPAPALPPPRLTRLTCARPRA